MLDEQADHAVQVATARFGDGWDHICIVTGMKNGLQDIQVILNPSARTDQPSLATPPLHEPSSLPQPPTLSRQTA